MLMMKVMKEDIDFCVTKNLCVILYRVNTTALLNT